MRYTLSLFFISALLLGIRPAGAAVNIRNGNFYMSYTDIEYSGGFEPQIERVYNSKTPFKGMFGWGWGSLYELHLELMPEGAIIVTEYGGGTTNYFAPET